MATMLIYTAVIGAFISLSKVTEGITWRPAHYRKPWDKLNNIAQSKHLTAKMGQFVLSAAKDEKKLLANAKTNCFFSPVQCTIFGRASKLVIKSLTADKQKMSATLLNKSKTTTTTTTTATTATTTTSTTTTTTPRNRLLENIRRYLLTAAAQNHPKEKIHPPSTTTTITASTTKSSSTTIMRKPDSNSISKPSFEDLKPIRRTSKPNSNELLKSISSKSKYSNSYQILLKSIPSLMLPNISHHTQTC